MRHGQPENGSENRFGGWRDWLLVLVGIPVALTGMAAFAAVWRSGDHPRPWPVVVGLVGGALLLGLLVGLARRRG